MKSAISRASITASTGLSDSAQIVRGGSNLTTVGAIPYVQSSGVLTQSAGLTFSDAANVRLATLAGGSSQSTNALLDVTNSAGTGHHLTVLGDGKVGVGTNAPSTNLEVRNAGAVSLRLNNSSSGTIIDINSDAGGVPRILVPASNGLRFDFGTGATRMFIGASVGIGTSNTTPANATLSILDATASTGSTATWIGHDGSGTYSGVHLSALTTSLKVVAGTVQGSTNLQEWQNNSGTALTVIQSDGRMVAAEVRVGASTSAWSMGYNSPQVITGSSNAIINWTSGAFTATPDTSLSRIGAGIVGVGTGAAGSVAGTLQAATLQALGAGTASNPMLLGSGTWFTGGSATTTKPYLLIEPSGTTSTGWSTSGTGLGVNAASGFAGNLLDLQVAGVSKLKVDQTGTITMPSGAQVLAGSNIRTPSTALLLFDTRTVLSAPSDGNLRLTNNAQTDFSLLQFGGTTSAFPAWQRSTTGLIARLADNSADTWVQASQFRSTLTTPASAAATGVAGTIVADADYVYVCTATNTWKRVAIATW